MMINPTNNPKFKNEDWMTTADAMAYLKVSRRTLQRWCAGKEIPYAYMGGTKYFPKKFIEHLLHLKTHQSLAPNPNPLPKDEAMPSKPKRKLPPPQ